MLLNIRFVITSCGRIGLQYTTLFSKQRRTVFLTITMDYYTKLDTE